jgi:hypothetical protein
VVVDPHDTGISFFWVWDWGRLGMRGGMGDTLAQDFDFNQFLMDLTRHGDEEVILIL